MTEKYGILGSVLLWDWVRPSVLSWIVVELNKHQSGSGYNVQQYLHDVDQYHKEWSQHCHDSGFSYKTWGKGASSHDRMCETFLKDKYGADLHVDTVTEFTRTHTFMKALHMLSLVLFCSCNELVAYILDYVSRNAT